jgi:hypothetical protein
LADWIAQNRESLIIFSAALVAVLPLVVGTLLGHIPKQYFSGWLVWVSAATLLLAFAVRYIEHRLGSLQRLLISTGFGLVWVSIGLHLMRVERASGRGTSLAAAQARKTISVLFLVFGLIWIGVSGYQFLR